jgi:hypothetical protein
MIKGYDNYIIVVIYSRAMVIYSNDKNNEYNIIFKDNFTCESILIPLSEGVPSDSPYPR